MKTGLKRATIVSAMGLAMAAASAIGAANAQTQLLAFATEQNNGSSNPAIVSPRDASDEINIPADFPARLRRQVVDYPTSEAAGTVIVDTPNTYLYYVLGGGKAIRYGIGVGRDGFTWSGTRTIERKTEWPDWFPPDDMLVRQPYLPRFMAGGPGNPLGARALYLSGTVYRIHGTNKPSSIGTHVSSGCIRMLNADVSDLYTRTRIGTKVVVLPAKDAHVAQAAAIAPPTPRTPAGVHAGVFDQSMR
jgi:lipoprotein-anchoring transpeptidase ErfK/SrfK